MEVDFMDRDSFHLGPVLQTQLLENTQISQVGKYSKTRNSSSSMFILSAPPAAYSP